MGVWTLFPGKNFFPALELVIVKLFTNFFLYSFREDEEESIPLSSKRYT